MALIVTGGCQRPSSPLPFLLKARTALLLCAPLSSACVEVLNSGAVGRRLFPILHADVCCFLPCLAPYFQAHKRKGHVVHLNALSALDINCTHSDFALEFETEQVGSVAILWVELTPCKY